MSWFVNVVKLLICILTKVVNKVVTPIVAYLSKSAPEEHFITFEGHVRGEPAPKVGCTCGWSYGPHRLLVMLNEAKDHERATGHRLIDSEYCE